MNQELKGKRLLILGGMRFSCEIVRKAQQMGIYTLVADYNKIEDSPGKQIADEAVDLSVIDVDAVVDYVKRNAIDGIFVGFNDMLLPYYAEICAKAGLPCYGTKEQFETLIAKNQYKALCRQFGVPTIPEYNLNDENIKYPVLNESEFPPVIRTRKLVYYKVWKLDRDEWKILIIPKFPVSKNHSLCKICVIFISFDI